MTATQINPAYYWGNNNSDPSILHFNDNLDERDRELQQQNSLEDLIKSKSNKSVNLDVLETRIADMKIELLEKVEASELENAVNETIIKIQYSAFKKICIKLIPTIISLIISLFTILIAINIKTNQFIISGFYISLIIPSAYMLLISLKIKKQEI